VSFAAITFCVASFVVVVVYFVIDSVRKRLDMPSYLIIFSSLEVKQYCNGTT
jgi:hypothetical protein